MAADNDWHGLMKYNQKQAGAKAAAASKAKAKKGAKAALPPSRSSPTT